MKNIAVILASGTGSRFGAKIPKQFVKLAGKPVIQYTLQSFQISKYIDEIIIVTNEMYIDFVNELVINNDFKKISKVISGGKERYESSFAAIKSIEEEECNVILHDAVRPFVSQRIIKDCVDALKEFNAIDVVVDPTDTIVKIKNGTIMSIPDRRFLARGQTPQCFKKTYIEKAYIEFLKENIKFASDDCGIFLRYFPNEPIGIVKGDESNFKITHQQDIYLADNLIKDGLLELSKREDDLIERHISDKVIVVFGGSSGIGKSIVVRAKTVGGNVYSFSRSNGVDISKSQDVKNALLKVHALEGRIDYVINTAGVLIKKPINFMHDDEIVNSCNTNYIGAINVAREAYPYLKESKGMLVNFTSSSFTRGRSTYSLYSSSKAAVVNLTQALSEEWDGVEIKVNCINPERTDTPMRRKNFGVEPVETLLTAEAVAEMTLSIMSSDYTGQIVSVKNK
ncbi:bifunctional cytidylyltransferase/SDR family oxidoreductase [Xenorhabdus sp. TS4]|uniref:bifunctional cytidylyltransferase/SDR family oxidoreductase n=1 Tax=Xenorhabdus sp. TS4 TaxID=1873483 RepID=UPI0016571A4F|nr:bifunctional cytidylyltransferase/SDR family oxidoreductase [Xenorhabdus sp. TS4]MBC8948503.1 bifunctional ribulose 5-phosphate reductase CDP-ribitol pyrophosphorylase [Xenorhabdus sp. TS4]